MADVNLTSGNDNYVEPYAERNEWRSFYGLAGNDAIRAYQGGVHPGPGNDVIERLVDPDNPNRQIHLALFDYGDNLRINLVEGFAESPTGGRDTLINIRMVHGNGSPTNTMLGDANDNYYWPNWGNDTFEGGAGNDGVSLNSGNVQVTPSRSRNLLLEEMNIAVSADGREATVTPKTGTQQWSIRTVDVEYFDVISGTQENAPWVQYRFADFITQQTMARDTIAAGGTLRWNAASPLGTAVAVTYSFVQQAPASGPGATGFRAFNEAERAWVREILASAAAVANVTFTEVAEGSGSVGQMRLGVSQQAASKGLSWLPGTPGAGDQAGDVWMDAESMLGLAPGTEGYQALLHEIGHALGLRHPRNVDAGDAWSAQLLAQHDRTALTVMSQNVSPDGLFRADWGPLDVLALRLLYGARSVNTGDTVYALVGRMGLGQFTFVDDGGTDTLDASALDGPTVLSLADGGISSVGYDARGMGAFDNIALTSGTVIERAIGSRFDDVLIGGAGANTLDGGGGSDWIDGGAGIDTVLIAGRRADYLIDNSNSGTFLVARSGAAGTETLVNIERITFSDLSLTLATSPRAADVVALALEDQQGGGSLPTPIDISNRSEVSYSLLDGPTHGSASVAANGTWSYTPSANFWGTDSFGWRASTATGSNDYRVYLQVQPVNDGAPTGDNLSVVVPFNTPYGGRVPVATDVDGDALTYALLSEPTKGALSWAADGSFTYTPGPTAAGDDGFSYRVSDGMGGANTYQVTLRIGLVTSEDTPLNTLLPDPVGALRSAATYAVVSQPQRGSLTLSPQGSLGYTPSPDAFGDDSFAYTMTVAGVATRIDVPLRVLPVNDAPQAAAGNASTPEDQVLQAQLPAATDVEGNAVTYGLASAAAHGVVVVNANGSYRYTPAANYFGPDTFTFSVSDGQGASSSYNVALSVSAVNDPPTGGITLVGAAALGQTLGFTNNLADAEGLGVFTTTWLRGDVAIAGASSSSYTLVAADLGQSIRVRLSYTDGQGQAESAISPASATVLAFSTVNGSAGNDSLPGSANPDEMNGLDGNDTLAGGASSDRLNGGAGDDLLVGGSGADTLDGGTGYDVAVFAGNVAVVANLATGVATQGGDSESLIGIEALIGSAAADSFTGLDGSPLRIGEVFRAGGGNDSIHGGIGIDRADYSGTKAAYTVTRTSSNPERLTVSHAGGSGADGTDTLTSVERLLFADSYFAFGDRAIDVARVAFVLWSPGIAVSTALFAKGINFYDLGYDFDTLVSVGIGFHTEFSDSQLATRLIAHVPGTTHTADALLALMASSGGGATGRAAATKLMALDGANLESVRLAGFIDNGIAASLDFGYFTPLPAGG